MNQMENGNWSITNQEMVLPGSITYYIQFVSNELTVFASRVAE